MKLHRSARMYAKVPVTVSHTDVTTPQVRFAPGGPWHNMEWVGSGLERTARILIAGPDATNNPPGTVVLPEGRTIPHFRLVDDPEDAVVRAKYAIEVT